MNENEAKFIHDMIIHLLPFKFPMQQQCNLVVHSEIIGLHRWTSADAASLSGENKRCKRRALADVGRYKAIEV